MTRLTIIFILTLISVTFCYSQNVADSIPFTQRDNGELKMTFPSIYFKHNSTDYAIMPYKVDSCFKYIALHIKDIHSLVIWRDSLEIEGLTNKRIKKLKMDINKYISSNKINIHSMGKEQKISRHTINRLVSNEQIQYLLSLNSVFDISSTHFLCQKKCKEKNSAKRLPHLVWCGWRYGFHWK